MGCGRGYADVMGSDASFVGSSAFLRWFPKVMLALAGFVLVSGWPRSIQWAVLLALGAYVYGRWLPWRFDVLDEGIALTFAFGRHLFLPKRSTTVRLEHVGAFALPQNRRRLGYPLANGLGFRPDRERGMRLALLLHGYRIT
jgi:hypothetical protein